MLSYTEIPLTRSNLLPAREDSEEDMYFSTVANQHNVTYVKGQMLALLICELPWGPLLQQQPSLAVKNQAVHRTVPQAL